MYKRLLDNHLFVKDSEGFNIRRYTQSYLVIPIVFLIAYIVFIGISNYFNLTESTLYFGTTSLIFITLALFSFFYLYHYQKIITTIEFQNALFANATNQATEFGAILRHDGTIVYVTPKYRFLFEKVSQKHKHGFDALVSAGIITKIEAKKLAEALKQGGSESVEVQLVQDDRFFTSAVLSLQPIDVVAEDDYPEDIRLSLAPLSRPSGYFFLCAKDLSQESKHTDLLDTFNIGYIATKDNSNIIAANQYAAEILGITSKDWKSKKIAILDFISKEKDKETLLQLEKNWQGIIDLSTKKKEIKRVFLFANRNQLDNNNLEYIILPIPNGLAASHKTPINKIEQAWIEYSPIATAIIDKQSKILQYNEAFQHILQSQNYQVLEGKKVLTQFINKNDASEAKKWFQSIKKHETKQPFDTQLNNKNITLYLNALYDQNNESKEFILHIIDTTELKNLEMRFVHSQKMQAVGQLAGGIAHDFNNLLTAMMGFCDILLLRHPAGDQSFADLMQIKQNANRAANLVRQLLAFSRKQTLLPKIVNINDTLADLSNLIGRLIGEDITLDMDYSRNTGNVKADQGQLEQVIVNLAVNARDAMPEGGTLRISSKNITVKHPKELEKTMVPPAEDEVIEKGDYVLIEVSDSGEGIPKGNIGKIFEPFYSTKKVGEGTGLGLATVYGIIKQTGGYIYVKSEKGKGTTFSIFLKKYVELDQTLHTNKPVSKKDTTEIVEDLTGKGTVLIVEDETPVRLFSMNALMNKGYNIFEAVNGESALEIIKEHGEQINIIITDVIMPGMNGPEMIEEVLKDYPNMKVIFVSGYAEDEFMKTYGDNRQFNFMPKPYTLKQLASKVKEVLLN